MTDARPLVQGSEIRLAVLRMVDGGRESRLFARRTVIRIDFRLERDEGFHPRGDSK